MAGQTLTPPLIEKTIDARGETTQPWAEWFQTVSDRLSKLGLNAGAGVTDGSEAAAGQVGEYLTASGSVALV